MEYTLEVTCDEKVEVLTVLEDAHTEHLLQREKTLHIAKHVNLRRRIYDTGCHQVF